MRPLRPPPARQRPAGCGRWGRALRHERCQLHKQGHREHTTRARDTDDTGGACGLRTPLGLAATTSCMQVTNNISCSAVVKPRETVLQSSTPLLRLLSCAGDTASSGRAFGLRPAGLGPRAASACGRHSRQGRARSSSAARGHAPRRRALNARYPEWLSRWRSVDRSLSSRFFPFSTSVNFG